ncbi:hypothetical protein [Legionella worsleiensis]|uniref:Lipase n=1 Tax=Legionella worsleiensis TaxID=45076 RepID=A0A0W1A965_9GAMM|nr:hypothetical protein [Legionella worsleiensis]KTD77865.1 hypothetical protein Lwor_1747 [Legionella worsleiensis]STY33110.1 Uncharacterised protein [Legionella worsleiensis]
MDFLRKLIALFFVLFSPFTQALPDNKPNPGVALVHGTRDHRVDAYGGYWKIDFIDSMSKALTKPENLFVVHCDFSQYMWHEDAANCVADQLINFIKEKKISSMTVYTHSDGANIIRWILSNPTYDRRYLALKPKIKQVIAIAPSSLGTPLADEVLGGGVLETSLAWLLGYLSDAVKQQRVGDMLIYNDELLLGGKGRPSLSTPFKVIVGTDVQASPFSSSSYCNGYLLNSGLKITKLYLDNCADGFLNCTSQLAAGELLFYDKDKTENRMPLSHNQSRHSCFGFDNILISTLSTEGAVQ